MSKQFYSLVFPSTAWLNQPTNTKVWGTVYSMSSRFLAAWFYKCSTDNEWKFQCLNHLKLVKALIKTWDEKNIHTLFKDVEDFHNEFP